MMADSTPLDFNEEETECQYYCHWGYLFTDEKRRAMQDATFNAGLITMTVGLLLNCTILMSKKLRSEACYRNLLNYTMVATLRRAVPCVVMVLPFRCLIDWIGEGEMSCNFFGFVDTFVAVYEIESLAQVTIERFIRALYTYKGWHKPSWHNKLFILISLCLAGLYSSFPLLGYGSYGRDFNCASCTFDVLLPVHPAYKLIVIIVFVLKNLKPTVVMLFSLNYARWTELNMIQGDHKNNVVFTLSICIMVMVNILFWFPIFLVRTSVILAQLLKMNYELIWSPCFVIWAMFMHWLSPAIAMIGFVWFNPRVRVKMANVINGLPIDSDEPTTPPNNAEEKKETKTQETQAQKDN